MHDRSRFHCPASAAVLLLAITAARGAALQPPKTGVEFNGAATHAVVKDGKAFDLDAFTLALWVKARAPRGGPQVFLNRGPANRFWTFYIYKKGVRMLVAHREPGYTHAIAPFPPADKWTHYAGTYDGKTIKVYMNGKLQATTPAAGRMARADAPLFVGALSPFERHFNGELDDIRIWKRALTDQEVAQLPTAAASKVDATGLIGRWTGGSLKEGVWRNQAVPELSAKLVDDAQPVVRRAPGYRGIWYSNQAQKDKYVYKYSGGLGTYCAKHAPFAVYCKEVNKTFFCYGGTTEGNRTLLHMVSWFDHNTGTVPRPVVLLDKRTTDAHDNPVISVDDEGYIWIFSSSHGTARPSYISVSKKPYDISAFERVLTTNFSYTQPWHVPGKGFVFVHTIYRGGRCNYVMTSPDGRKWSEPQLLAKIEMGHYQVSRRWRQRVGTAFNFHPAPKGLNWRTNLYYMQSDDFAKTWTTADGRVLDLPLRDKDNPALVHNFQAEKLNVYMKQVAFDPQGHPVILFVTSKGWQAGPENGPRFFRTARWSSTRWIIEPGSVPADNNYDTGSLYIEAPDLWRLIAPTHVGPQPFNPGGEIGMWTSSDQGKTWRCVRQLTRNSRYNHTYVRRPVNAHEDFYGFWADGHGRQPSDSRLYFCDKAGNVFRLPVEMDGETAKPERYVPPPKDAAGGGEL
jgi:hypothetical protein